ncbi:hypothetical protein F4802DRAFT_611360 [Xylaria palmicola]|nr:hypothetical protein F4802DRAFT_611360 [Xylaria palmicola]
MRTAKKGACHQLVKEQQALELAIKLRTNGIIITLGKPFKELNATEINELVAQGVFEFIAYNPALKDKYPSEIILRIHYREKLRIQVFTYDPCLLYTYNSLNTFGITGMQTDDTLSFATLDFFVREEKELQRANFRAKPKETLSPDHLIEFNGGKISFLQAVYNLAIAVQVAELQLYNVKDNLTKGFIFIPFDFCCTKLFLGFIIVLVTEFCTKDLINLDFEIQGNIVYWNLSKCKRVTQSVLASELYGIVNGFNSAIAFRTTLKNIIEVLNLPPILTVLCSDLKSLLMIDIMSFRELYEKKEILERAPNQALETLVSTNKLLVRVEALIERL